MIRQNPQFDQPAKVCEVFDNLYGNTFNWMTFTGLLVHMFREEREKGEALPQAVEDAYAVGMERLEGMDRYLAWHVEYEVIPIRKLIPSIRGRSNSYAGPGWGKGGQGPDAGVHPASGADESLLHRTGVAQPRP